VDLARQLAERERLWPQENRPTRQSPPEPETVQPALASEAKRKALWERHTQHYQQLLGEALPMLDGLTPRQAAQNAALRPRLVEWLKGHLHHIDSVNRRDGLDLNLDWAMDELGVPELK
jgi:hypothetical protein